MLRRLVTAVVAAGVTMAAGWACYSDRAGTGPSAGSCKASLDPDQFGSVVIAIEGFAFHPASVTVAVGGSVTWVNCESEGTPSHTTTSDDGIWDSAPIDPGSTHTETFPNAGTFDYHCTPHPSMTGLVVVQ